MDPDRLRIAPPAEVSLVAGRAVGAKPLHRRLWLADGTVLTYDVLSMNTGSRRLPTFAARPASDQPRVWSGHSTTDLIGLARVLGHEPTATVVVVGGTQRAHEIAGGLSARPNAPHITLLCPEEHNRRRDRAAYRRLAWRGVDIVTRVSVDALAAGAVHTRDGRRFAADHMVWAAPAVASPLAQALGLPATHQGLRVDRRLQSLRSPWVFGTGEIASLDGRRLLPGWDAERQVDVMLANLHGLYDRRSLRSYRVPERALPLDLGQGELVAGPLTRRLAARRLRVERSRWLGLWE
ncbi:FAD-dependent oxidoreductase [Salinisphaera sp. SPP-AMP-43]|uniref:FAD-dependent oxidoreductase n=1 Tax=Salinisphaera sp. SPP-AMP-43 TaxID=3121288 RepID=UPI003C6E6ED8